jgi:hypothetical protein
MEGPNLGKYLPPPCLYAVESTNAHFPQIPSPQFMDIVMFNPRRTRRQTGGATLQALQPKGPGMSPVMPSAPSPSTHSVAP